MVAAVKQIHRQSELSPARQALQDNLADLARADEAVVAAKVPIARLDELEADEAAARVTLKEFNDAYESALSRWAGSGRGERPAFDADTLQALHARLANATAAAASARNAKAGFEEAEARARSNVLLLESRVPALVLAVVEEEFVKLAERRAESQRELAELDLELDAALHGLFNIRQFDTPEHAGKRLAEKFQKSLTGFPVFGAGQIQAAQGRFVRFVNKLAADPAATREN